MPSFEEVSAWSEEELTVEIRLLLPPGWVLVTPPSNGYWTVSLQRKDPEGNPVVEWEDDNADKRLVLLNAFWWLWSKGLPKPTGLTPWSRAQDRVVKPVSLTGSKIPDPEDLNPAEIEALYKMRK